MENQEHFGRLTDRMATFREEVLEEKPYIDAEQKKEWYLTSKNSV